MNIYAPRNFGPTGYVTVTWLRSGGEVVDEGMPVARLLNGNSERTVRAPAAGQLSHHIQNCQTCARGACIGVITLT